MNVRKDMQLFEFQKAGVEFLNTKGNKFLCDEMGLGKTIQVIKFLEPRVNEETTLIICPAIMKLKWQAEIKKWLGRDAQVICCDTTSITSNVLIINYDILAKKFNLFDKIFFHNLVVDESHYVKNYKAIRTQFVQKLCRKSRKKILLTGTPIMNKPEDLYQQLALLGNFTEIGQTWFEFSAKFLQQNNFGNIVGYKNLSILNKFVNSGQIILRREKKDVLKDLPDKIYEKIMLGGITIIKPDDFNISEQRHKLGLEKCEHVIEFLKDWEGDKAVIFAHHLDVLKKLHASFNDSVIITGEQNDVEKTAAVNRFNTDASVKFCFASILATGIGIDLTSASNCFFVEFPYNFSQLKQAEDRLHRIGQKNNVLITYFVASDSEMDLWLKDLLENKEKMTEMCLAAKNL